MKKETKVLVLYKERLDYAGNTIGLANSAKFLTSALVSQGYNTKLNKVLDGNGIDKEVAIYKPNLVILEALWATPDKIRELSNIYTNILWVVRVHSNIPFLSMEGVAIKQIKELSEIRGVLVSSNNLQTSKELSSSLGITIQYLPNLYFKQDYTPNVIDSPKNYDSILDISCFGAIRPMKNQLIQTLAAIHVADRLNKILHFHINSTRVEQKADPVLKNIEACFSNTRHKLVEHEWETHPKFLQTVSQMNLGMQVSFTESYNIVVADHVHVGIPVVVSPDINWLGKECMASSTNLVDISDKIVQVLSNKNSVMHNTTDLQCLNIESSRVWKTFLDNIK